MKLVKRGDLMFTRENAIQICKRKLYFHNNKARDDCYYRDTGRCELNGGVCDKPCIHYVNDIVATNTFRENILYHPERIIEQWDELCYVDKELFMSIYPEYFLFGDVPRSGKSARQLFAKEQIDKILNKNPLCPKCGAELPRYPCYDEYYEIRTCPDCGKVYRKKRVGVK